MSTPQNFKLVRFIPIPSTNHPGLQVTVEGVIGLLAGQLKIDYDIQGQGFPGILWPAFAEKSSQSTSVRCNDKALWQHTCVEVFVALHHANNDRTSYIEYNFSSSGEWAQYRFSDYRENDAFDKSLEVKINSTISAQSAQIKVVAELPVRYQNKAIDVGISAVIQSTAKTMDYHALSHVSQQADFHQRKSFAITL